MKKVTARFPSDTNMRLFLDVMDNLGRKPKTVDDQRRVVELEDPSMTVMDLLHDLTTDIRES